MKNLLFLLIFLPVGLFAQLRICSEVNEAGTHFSIISNTSATAIYYDSSENALIQTSAEFLASDIEKVSGIQPALRDCSNFMEERIILLATLGNNPLIEELINNGKLNVDSIKGRWEAYIIETVEAPFPGVEEALIIVGSDRRGAAYGAFSLSEAMGVSPWYWWADVPVQKKEEIYLAKGRILSKGPKVKYRGIFLNDEAPALRSWATETFGGFNHRFYEKVFELILRNKGNYLWPAMWTPAMFAADDPLNPELADAYGIVISTSHHEPMMRAHAEWYSFEGGEWNYLKNKAKLQEFWRGGIERMGDRESVVTVGMRGDGDEAMSEETAVELMKEIIADQRQILEEVSGKAAKETPQVWAVYKEVQDYYDKGMRVDDDIMVLFCDDNWGNLRILPKKKDLSHEGGYGIYYHFDYVGAPVSYRWLNVNQIERTWEQMQLAWESGVKDLWLVNVGDLKPMELPISFFLDYAWNPEAIKASDLPDYYLNWAKQQFGEHYTNEIASLLSLYTRYNARRTPEMLKPDTYSLENYREAERILTEYRALRSESRQIYKALPPNYKAAFYQLLLSPIELCCNLNEMYVAAGKNNLYAAQGRASANLYADSVKTYFARDAELTREFHEDLLDGKWKHMMSQTHIGYTSWDNPKTNIMPEVFTIKTNAAAQLGYVIEHGTMNSFSDFDPINRQTYYLEIFNMGAEMLDFSLKAKEKWIRLSKTRGSIQYDEKIMVSVDWDKVPKGNAVGRITLKGAGKKYQISLPLHNELPLAGGFVENNGIVAFEAASYSRITNGTALQWSVVPNMGRTHSSLIAGPVNTNRQEVGKGAPMAEYEFTTFDEGELKVEAFVSPTQDFTKSDGLWYAVAIDDEEPQIININEGEIKPDYEYAEWWMRSVGDHIKIKSSKHQVEEPGRHVLKIWMLNPGIVFQKFVIDMGGHRSSYLGAPESKKVILPQSH